MEKGIEYLEDHIEEQGLYNLVHEYRKMYSDKPLSRLVEDIQQQIMIYANIIEGIKQGKYKDKTSIEKQFGASQWDLVRKVSNPGLLDWALKKLRKYREAFTHLITEYGKELLKELSISVGLATTLEVQLGFPTVSLSIGIEYSVGAEER
jgi:hypothetical protein